MAGRVDVYEQGREIVVELEVPGIAPERLRATIEEDCVRVRVEPDARADAAARRWHRRERRERLHLREIPLPRRIDPDTAQAALVRGLLVLRLRAAEAATPQARHLSLVEDVAHLRDFASAPSVERGPRVGASSD